jgi:sugar/nucleoside kinase (ribokinase family)
MTDRARYDVIGLGNAIVDILVSVDDAFVAEKSAAPKGGMTLIEEDRAESIYAAMPSSKVEASGGSTANTIAGVGSFGGKAAFLGKVADDTLGKVFRDDIRNIGVDYNVAPLKNGPATARCMILVTADGERAMNTYLGASSLFGVEDLDPEKIAASRIVYLEGYLFDRDAAKAAFVQAAEIAKAHKREVALTLSDAFCVDRHRESFRHLVKNHVDILFANERELLSLYETDDFDTALQRVRVDSVFAFVTRSAKGSIISVGDSVHIVDAVPPKPGVIDTTGAGDQYAAGALFGLANDRPIIECGRLGALAAAEVISHFGPRPEKNLRDLAKTAKLL